MKSEMPCPDGLLLAPDDPLNVAHTRLNQYFLDEEQRTPFDVTVWRKLSQRQTIDQVEAVLYRLAWLTQHDAELENAPLSRMRLTRLLRVLYSIKTPYTEPDLRRLLELTTPLLGRIAPDGPVDRVFEYLKTNDLTPGLCGALRSFQQNLQEGMASNQASMQSLRQCLHMLLWMDEWEPLDPSRCWSECIRRDFRAMTGDRRGKWRTLLKHLRGNAPVRIPAGWARQAELLLTAVGIDDFREQMHGWFAPFRSNEPLPLSVAGSHVLKGLIWFGAVARDEEFKECALWLLDVKWRQKRNTEKSMVALMEFGLTKEELRARNLIRADPPDPAPRLIERMRQAVCLQPANHIHMDDDGELIVIQGQLHFYRLFRSTGRIERVTDNAALELNWASIPDPFRMLLRRECDTQEQIDRRAFMLMNDAVFGRYFGEK